MRAQDVLVPTAFILNMFGTGLGIARNLGSYGIPVVGIDSRADTPGSFSRCCRCVIGPDSQNEPEQLVEFLTTIGKSQDQKGILFPTRDADVIFMNRFRKELETFYVIPQPQHDTLDRIMNKARLACVAESVGIGTPLTIQISSMVELNKKQDTIHFPAVVKPIYAHQWKFPRIWEAVGRRKGIKVDEFRELVQVYEQISPHSNDIIVQEWVHGREDQFFVLGAYFDLNSECLGAFTFQKILQYPPDFGLGCLDRTVHNEEVWSLGIRLLKAIGFTGIAEVEFKKDSRTGKYLLIEVNPRHWDQHTLGTACGVNLSYLAYIDLCTPVPPPQMVQEAKSIWWMSGGGLYGVLKESLRERKCGSLRVLPTLLLGKKVFALYDWHDPKPFLRLMTIRKKSQRLSTRARRSRMESS